MRCHPWTEAAHVKRPCLPPTTVSRNGGKCLNRTRLEFAASLHTDPADQSPQLSLPTSSGMSTPGDAVYTDFTTEAASVGDASGADGHSSGAGNGDGDGPPSGGLASDRPPAPLNVAVVRSEGDGVVTFSTNKWSASASASASEGAAPATVALTPQQVVAALNCVPDDAAARAAAVAPLKARVATFIHTTHHDDANAVTALASLSGCLYDVDVVVDAVDAVLKCQPVAAAMLSAAAGLTTTRPVHVTASIAAHGTQWCRAMCGTVARCICSSSSTSMRSSLARLPSPTTLRTASACAASN